MTRSKVVALVGGLSALGGAVAGAVAASIAAGFTASWFAGPWAWNNFSLLGLIGFSAGAVLTRVLSRGSPSSSSPATTPNHS